MLGALQAEYTDGTPQGAEMPKDELTHAAYWELMGFEDPTPPEKQREFALCGVQCGSEVHDEDADEGELAGHMDCTQSVLSPDQSLLLRRRTKQAVLRALVWPSGLLLSRYACRMYEVTHNGSLWIKDCCECGDAPIIIAPFSP